MHLRTHRRSPRLTSKLIYCVHCVHCRTHRSSPRLTGRAPRAAAAPERVVRCVFSCSRTRSKAEVSDALRICGEVRPASQCEPRSLSSINTRTTDKVGENDTSPKQNSPDKKPIARRNNLVQPLEQPREQVGITCGRRSWRVPMLLSLSFSRLRFVTFFSMASHPELNQT